MSPRRPILHLRPAMRRAIIAHARRARPLECCGFLVGRAGEVAYVVPMENVAESPVRYRIDERAHIELRRTLRRFQPALTIVGVYHSHPAGRAEPSPTDIGEAFYPEWTHVIVGLGGSRPVVRAFRMNDGRGREVSLR